MKKLILIPVILLFVGFTSVSAQCCNTPVPGCPGNQEKARQAKTSTEVQAYYFHATRRCATCNAVEDVTKEALKELYGDKVAFFSVNREEDKNNPLIKKHKINSQTLLIIKGDEVVNLTNDAFMNARTHPDKLRAKIKETVDSLM